MKPKRFAAAVFIGALSTGCVAAYLYAGQHLFGNEAPSIQGSVFTQPFATNAQRRVTTEASFIVAASAIFGAAAAKAIRQKGKSAPPFAPWAFGRFQDMVSAGIFSGDSVVLGQFKRRIVIPMALGHALIVGGSRSGKTSTTGVPTILMSRHSLFIYDPKRELVELTSGFRQHFSIVLVVDLTRENSARYNPLQFVRKGPLMMADLANIYQDLQSSSATGTKEEFWVNSGNPVFCAIAAFVLFTAPDDEKHLGTVRAWVMNLEETASRILSSSHFIADDEPSQHPELVSTANMILSYDEKLRGSIQATVLSLLVAFSDPIVIKNTSTSDFSPSQLMCEEHPFTIYLAVSPADVARTSPVIRLMTNQVARALLHDPETAIDGSVKRHKAIFLLDEMAQLGRLYLVDPGIHLMAGYGVYLVGMVQSLKMLNDVYGPQSSVLDSIAYLLFLSGSDPETLQRFSTLVGTASEYRESTSRAKNFFSRRDATLNEGEQTRVLLTPGDLRRLPSNEAILLINGLPPFRVNTIQYWKEPFFKARLLPAIEPGQAVDAVSPIASEWAGVQAHSDGDVTTHVDHPEDEDALASPPFEPVFDSTSEEDETPPDHESWRYFL